MRTASLVSLQSCQSVDSDAWSKGTLIFFNNKIQISSEEEDMWSNKENK